MCHYYKTESGCRFGEQCASFARISWQSAQQQTEKDWWSRFCYVGEDCQAIRLCIPEYGAVDIQFDFTEGHKILGTTTQRASLIRYINFRERKRPSQGMIQHTGFHARYPSAPKFEDRSEEENFETRARRPQRRLGSGINLKLKEKNKPLSSRLRMFRVYQHYP